MPEPQSSVSRERVPVAELAVARPQRVYLIRRADGRYAFSTTPDAGAALAAFSPGAAHPDRLVIHEPPALDASTVFSIAGRIHL